MKIDLYTKAVLTVIAACLVWICVNGATPVVGAQVARPEPTPVMLVDAKGNPLITADGLRVHIGTKAVPVFVTNRALAVAVGAIQRSAVWDPIQVQIMREPPTQRPVP